MHYYILHSQNQNIKIANREELIASDSRREDCLRIIESGMNAANPASFVSAYLKYDVICTSDKNVITNLDKYSTIHTVAFGKASDTMTQAANSILKDRLTSGIIILPKGVKSVIKGKKFRIFNARHPIPDQTSVKAAKESIKFLQARRDCELVIFLISGGGSSLCALPDGVTLGEKIHVTNLLLKSGATIQEMNLVRKCLSGVKGGKLAKYLKCDGIGLLMSDVQTDSDDKNDEISNIASGPTVTSNVIKNDMKSYDNENKQYQDALNILEKYKLTKKSGHTVIDILRQKAQHKNKWPTDANASQNTTTVKHTDDSQKYNNHMIGNYIVARNSDCINKMIETGKKLGYSVADVSPIHISGDIKKAADIIYAAILQNENKCIIFGGESTVKVLGDGKGGRNQELVLRLLKKTQKIKYYDQKKKCNIIIASAGTDGVDGNSIYAGAMTCNDQTDIDSINDAIKKSDSCGFFEKRRKNKNGGVIPPSHIRTGPTHTNLMDIGLILT